MFFRRSPTAEIEPVHRALAEGRYEAALALLEGAAKRGRQRGKQRSNQAQFKLSLAAAYALYGEDGLEGGLLYLGEAAEADTAVTHTPLYRALYWEFAAYQGEPMSDVKRGALTAAQAGDATAIYHAACALAAIHAFKRATEMLLEVDAKALPAYLEWRYWSLLGRSYEAQGLFEEAADAFEHASTLCPCEDKFSELLNLAANRLEALQPNLALAALERAERTFYADSASERAVQRYLTGRAHLLLGNPNTALNLFLEASVSESAAGESSFSLRLALGQTYSLLGKLRRAAESYSEAVQLASKRQRALALHEYALLMLEANDLERAKELLQEAAEDEHYDLHAEAYADLADVELRLGNLRSADALAQRALDLGATTPACLTLGNIAHEYSRFDEAIVWFEKAASASARGSAEWLFAKEMLVDSFVQQGYAHPDRVIHHAEAVLHYLSPFDEWTLLMQGYLDHAKALLGGKPRLLN